MEQIPTYLLPQGPNTFYDTRTQQCVCLAPEMVKALYMRERLAFNEVNAQNVARFTGCRVTVYQPPPLPYEVAVQSLLQQRAQMQMQTQTQTQMQIQSQMQMQSHIQPQQQAQMQPQMQPAYNNMYHNGDVNVSVCNYGSHQQAMWAPQQNATVDYGGYNAPAMQPVQQIQWAPVAPQVGAMPVDNPMPAQTNTSVGW